MSHHCAKKLTFYDFSCSLRDWKALTEVIKIMETSLPRISVGTVNHLLHSFGKVGKIDTMMKVTAMQSTKYSVPCHM